MGQDHPPQPEPPAEAPTPDTPPAAKPRRLRGAAVFVGCVWALMLLADLAYVRLYGSNVPSWDEWDMVPTLTGEQPITAEWLWSQHNEHRVPLPRLVILGLNRVFGCDFRVAMYFNVVSLGLAALGLIVMAARLRGWASVADAFFPLALLHWGHGSNFLWGWQVTQIIPTLLALGVLLLIVGSGAVWSRWKVLLAGLGLVLLPLCGANGVALVPAFALWLAGLAVCCRRDRKGTSLLAGTLAALAILLSAAYFIGYERVPYHPESAGLLAALGGTVRLVSLCFGPAVVDIWHAAGLTVLGLCLASALLLVLVARRQPRERRRVWGLLLFFGALGSLALGVGWGRATQALEPRYAVFIVPIWCGVYWTWSLHGPGDLNPLIRYGLCGAMCLALWGNTQTGIAYGTNLRHVLGAFESDLRAGVPPYVLIHRYGNYLHPHHDIVTDYLPMLQRAGVGDYRLLRPNPPFQEIALRLRPSRVKNATWARGLVTTTGPDSELVFTLPEQPYVGGIRLTYSYPGHDDALTFVSLYWKPAGEKEFSYNHYSKYSPTGDRANWAHATWCRLGEAERTFTVWVCGRVAAIRLQPDFHPCACRITALTLLIPPTDEAPEK